jgi:hypothetical protein
VKESRMLALGGVGDETTPTSCEHSAVYISNHHKRTPSNPLKICSAIETLNVYQINWLAINLPPPTILMVAMAVIWLCRRHTCHKQVPGKANRFCAIDFPSNHGIR